QLAWHGLFTALAIAVAVWLGIRLAERRGMPADPLANIAFWGVVGGLIGARLFHVFDHLPMYLANPGLIFAVWEGGVAAYGGFIGGIIGGLAVARYYRLSLWPLLDAVGPALLIGQAIG